MIVKTWKKIAATGAAAAVAGMGMLATAAPASAATYGGQCGSGYGVIRSASVGGEGTAFLTYNSSNATNCVVVIRNNPGSAVLMNAWIKRSSESTWRDDRGYYTTYAGPVYRNAPSQCVDWGGYIQGGGRVDFTNDACG
ncbi:spore-associated protein A [Nocardiopsis sediminis]|uniref:Spore-associated protein A n=1 Tax=Nocardiopsis sediminis TaxID=1778267 RepID=A0ABV8FJW9_9ACTN